MPLSGHQQIPMAQILYHPSVYLAFSRSPARFSNKYVTQLRMCSLGAKEVAAVDSSFALVRARQHCIARTLCINIFGKLMYNIGLTMCSRIEKNVT